MKTWMSVVLGALAAMALVGCMAVPVVMPVAESVPALSFRVHLAMNPDGRLVVTGEVENCGSETFSDTGPFEGILEIRDDSDELLVRVEAHVLASSLAPGESAFPVGWKGTFSPGRFKLTWGASPYGAVTAQFEIEDGDGSLRLGGGLDVASLTRLPDSVGYGQAAEPVQTAKADLADMLGIGVEDIQVLSVERVIFPDTSLGVPQPGESYLQVLTPGYVIKLLAAAEVYEYHAGSGRVIRAPVSSSPFGQEADMEPPATPRQETQPGANLAGSIVVERVQVASDEAIRVGGTSTLPDGTCILTELYANDQPVEWWPADECAIVQGGQWDVRVPLGQGGAPSQLAEEVQYLLRAWQKGDPEFDYGVFAFDITPPPPPLTPTPAPATL